MLKRSTAFSESIWQSTCLRIGICEPVKWLASKCNLIWHSHIDALDATLADRPYLPGARMSAADISNCYVMRVYQRLVTNALPANVQAFFDRMTALPSYERTVAADALA